MFVDTFCDHVMPLAIDNSNCFVLGPFINGDNLVIGFFNGKGQNCVFFSGLEDMAALKIMKL